MQKSSDKVSSSPSFASCKAMLQFMRLNQSKLSTCSDTWSLQMLRRCRAALCCTAWFFTPFSLYRISGSCQTQRCKHCGPARTSADQRKDGPAQDQALTQSTRPERLCQWSEVECCWCLRRWFQSWHLCSTSQPRTYGALWREGWISSLFVFISGLTKNHLYTNFINLKT